MATLKASASQTIIDMTDGFTVSLSQDSAAWNGGVSNLGTAQTASIAVSAYQGASVATYSVGTPTCSDSSNCTATVSGTNVNITVKASATKGGTVTIPVTCGPSGSSVVINKTFSYSISLRGEQGEQGEQGDAGKGVSSVTPYYLTTSSSSGITVSSTGWDTAPTATTTTNKYIWSYQKFTYTDGSTSNTTPAIIGTHGATGGKGDTGNGIASVTPYYLTTSSSSGVTVSTSGWSTEPTATTTTKKYLWSYTKTTYTDGNYSNSTPAIIGTHGATGEKGDAGNDAILLVITYDTMTLRNNTGSATMTAHVYVGGVEATISDTTGVVTLNGTTVGTVKWYVGSSTSGTAGKTFEASASSITNQQTYTAQLEA